MTWKVDVLASVQNGTLTTKNSPARNLHRLVSAVDFIKVLLQNLSEEPPVTLHTACATRTTSARCGHWLADDATNQPYLLAVSFLWSRRSSNHVQLRGRCSGRQMGC